MPQPFLTASVIALVALSACRDCGGRGITGPTSGSVQVTITTSGRVLDRDGYTVSLDGQAPVAVAVNHTFNVADLSPGTHTLALGGIAENCQATGSGSQGIQVVAGAVAPVRLTVQCAANRLAYVRDNPLEYSIFIQRLDGTGRAEVATGISGGRIDWSPDGHRIAYSVMNAEDSLASIWVVDIDSGTTRPVGPPITLSAFQPAWSPDGSRFAFAGVPPHGRADIYTMKSDGTDVRLLTPGLEMESMPVWSPDGSRIAYLRADFNNVTEIWVMLADGSGQERVVRLVDRYGYVQIDWSPDGSRLAFSDWRGGGQWEVYTIRPDGTGETRVTNTAYINERYVAFLPDGRIGFNTLPTYNPPPHEIWIMNADGTGVGNFSNTPDISESFPAWQ